MRNYEIMYIAKADLSDDQMENLKSRLEEAITSRGGAIEKVDDWGTRELAYEIDHMRKGHYVVLYCEASRDGISEFERICRINRDVIRYMVIRKDD